MTFHERSLDDLPLAAYSTGVVPDEPEELVPDPDLVASDPTAGVAPATAEPASPAVASVEAPDAAPKAPRRVSLRLPALRRKMAVDAASAPFQPVHPSVAAAGSFTAVTAAPMAAAPMAAAPMAAAPMAAAPMAAAPTFAASTLSAPSYGTPSITVPVGTPTPAAKPLGVLGRKPRELLRDPRVLAGGVVAIGLALLGVSLLGGGGPSSGAAGPGSSQNTTFAQPTPVPVGAATVEQTGDLKGTYELIGQTGAGPAVDSQVTATWGDSTGDTLGLTGLASAGTRATDANFVLTWSTFVAGAPVKFTSSDGECVIGMAVGAKAVSGGFVCKKLTSDDGKRTIDLKGSYRT
jgi:hypothetical protein